MPRGLKSHSNERIDLDDFRKASRDYTDERQAFDAKLLMLSRRALFVEGFRIEVSEQVANPGEISVFNGLAFDRTGELVNNEDQVNDARTITLTGASQYFYLEIEYIEDDADPDARAFWDAVYDNPSPDPDGREFALTVPTRLAPNWRIVTPASTTGFDATANPNSTRIPLAILHTSAANIIDGPGTIVYVNASTVLEQDVLTGASSIRVLNSRLFPDTGSMSIDFGGTVPELVSISANDRDNNILSFAPNLVTARQAGAIVRVTTIPARFIKENTSPTAVAVVGMSSTTTDARRRVFQGSEIRGAAVAQSKETFGARDDLNIESAKDYYDFMAAHLRDLRWGTMRTDATSKALPTTFSSPRYYDHAGGIMGARAHTLSIGDGVNSWGDFNGATDAVFIAAVAAMPVTGGTIYVKRGTYTFSNPVNVAKPIVFVGEGREAVTIVKAGATTHSFKLDPNALQTCGLEGMRLTLSAATTALQLQLGTGAVYLKDVHITGQTVVLSEETCVLTAENCKFINNTALGTKFTFQVQTTGYLYYTHFKSCEFFSSGTVLGDDGFSALDGGTLQYTTFDSCVFSGHTGLNLNASALVQVSVNNCSLQGTNRAVNMTGTAVTVNFSTCSISTSGSAGNSAVMILGGTLTGVSISGCSFTSGGWAAVGGIDTPNALLLFSVANIEGVSVNNCVFTGTLGTAYVTGIKLETCSAVNYAIRVQGCDFFRCYGVFCNNFTIESAMVIDGCKIDGDNQNRTNYGIYWDTNAASATLVVSNCVLRDQQDNTNAIASIYVNSSGGTSQINITNCVVKDIAQTAGSTATGMYFLGTASPAVYNVSNCTIDGVSGATGARGIWLDTPFAGPSLRVGNSHIEQVATTISGDAIGIYFTNATKSSFIGNRILDILGSSSSRCVWITNPSDVVISDNVLEDQLIVDGTSNCVNIQGNILKVNAALTQGVIRIAYSDGSTSVNVDSNTILMPNTLIYGVEIAGASATAKIYNLRVSGNIFTFGTLGGIGVWFSVGESFNTNITNNEMREPTQAAGSRAIYITSGTVQGHRATVVSGNSVYWATKTVAKVHAIYMMNCYMFTMANNIIYFGAGNFSGACIYMETVLGSIVGNVCSGAGTEASPINVTGATSIVMVASNFVDGSMGTVNQRIAVNTVFYTSTHPVGNIGAGNGVYGHNVVG